MKYSWIFIVSTLLSFCSQHQEDRLFTLMHPNETGVSFSNDLQSDDTMNILEYLYFYNGGGVAAGDINNDGWVDLYFTSNQGENKLYLNKGNFQFEDITATAKVTGDRGWSTGVTMADVNGDGLLDIYVCQVGAYKGIKGKNKLYINNGDLTFSEQASNYGIDFEGFSTQALFFDYDLDGDLDLYLLNHSIKKPEVFSHADTKFESKDDKGGDKLFMNLLSEGQQTMVEVTEKAGILSSSLGFGLGIAAADINGDGWIDLYVSNDFTEDDYLYINQQDGTFKESLEEYISSTSRYSMGNDINDINNDGLPDIFTTDMLPYSPEIWMKSLGEDKQEVYDVKKRLGYKDQYVRNHLHLNLGNGKFAEIGLLTNTYATDWSWSPLIFDMDNDGKKDLHITNGIAKRPNDLDFVQYSQEPNLALTPKEREKKQIELLPKVKLPNFTFHQSVNLKFEVKNKEWGLDQESYSTGSAYADLNNDGALDLITNNINQPAFIYRNNSKQLLNRNFIQFDLKGTGLNTFGIGAEVYVYHGGTYQHQHLSLSRGFQSSVSTTLTFGLDQSTQVDSVIVNWTGNRFEKFDAKVNQKNVLEQGKGRTTDSPRKKDEPQIEILDVGIAWKHQENEDFDDTRREYLIPQKFSTEGPALAVGDINGDGLEDIYFGGAKNQPGVIYLQSQKGEFIPQDNPFFEQLKMAEDVVAIFEDLNQDGHLDLFVGSAGNEYTSPTFFNFDRIFLNDGKGNLIFSPQSLPPISENTSDVAVNDVNKDGFPDLLITASVVSGNYGAPAKTHLLINDGKGKFTDQTSQYFGQNFSPGMVQKAVWVDVMDDRELELVMVGKWMPIQVYQKTGTGSYKLAENHYLSEYSGWHYSLKHIQMDAKDYLFLGNLGLNNKLKTSIDQPLTLFHADFDENGQEDPLLFHYMGNRFIPFASRDDLIKQIPKIKSKHKSYEEYSRLKSPESLLGEFVKSPEAKKIANNFESGYFVIDKSKTSAFIPFELEGQLSPLMDFAYVDLKDKGKFIVGVGNFEGFRNDLGKAMAQPIIIYTFQNQEIKPVKLGIPGKEYWGAYRKILPIHIGNQLCLIAVRNNDQPLVFKLLPISPN
jgi:enediyne biosynthesis protein E4